MTGNDPRSIDPALAETDEADVARQDGSSTPDVDEEEREGHDLSSGSQGDGAALRGMTAADGGSGDQVTSRQPDSTED
ncbi:hypothetical protein GCM10011519_13990 [Marmoricola endophyticus]|uniref:Uncharacterized protein n=1 Tax=Marmoricola endophyticus TaxID=2040280 RepID=A0A917F2A8_9ACTN|nr:hypothetical protein [Marmoricola endophyticus]GGF41402.1 hypothetical protein GCM10011519_13990 [Marmoricola endophyticus]